MEKFLNNAFKGDPRSIGRLISLVEADTPSAKEIMKQIYPRTGKAKVIGITGSPGAGKSTFVDRLIEQFKADNMKVGVIAIDPSSPFTGGAILGDRLPAAVECTIVLDHEHLQPLDPADDLVGLGPGGQQHALSARGRR